MLHQVHFRFPCFPQTWKATGSIGQSLILCSPEGLLTNCQGTVEIYLKEIVIKHCNSRVTDAAHNQKESM